MELRGKLLETLDLALRADGAACGNIQLFNRRIAALEIEVQRGFGDAFLAMFRWVRPDEPSACGRAFRQQRRVMVPDVDQDPHFLPYRSMAHQAGFRAVQSTPIKASGEMRGVLSTHFAHAPHHLTADAESLLDLCAGAAGQLLERFAAARPHCFA